MRKADALGAGPVDHRRAQSARLRHKSDLAGQRGAVGKARIQSERRHQKANAVRAQDTHAAGPGDLQHLFLQCLAAGIVMQAEPGSHHHRRRHGAGGEIAHHLRHNLWRHANNRQIGSGRQMGDLRIGQHTVDSLDPGVDRHDGAVKPTRDQVVHHHLPDRARTVRGPDEGYRTRVKQRIEMMNAHGYFAPK